MVVVDMLSTLTSLNLPKDHQNNIREMKRILSNVRSSGLT